MICLIALVVFGILGIFSARYRGVAKEAFECVFRRITLRKCTTGLDKRLKSRITGKLMRKHPKFAKGVYRHFEVISWIFMILLFASLGYSVYSVTNLVIFGNCYGPEPNAFCVFDPFLTEREGECSLEGPVGQIIGKLTVSEDDPSIGPADARVVIIEAGCFQCPFTKKAVPVIKQILSYYGDKIRFVYKDFPVSSTHPGAEISAEAAQCAKDQGKFWEYSDILFENQGKASMDDLKGFARELGLDMTQFSECLETRKYKEKVDSEFQEALRIGIYGTPTFFINDQVVVGPRSFEEFKQMIDIELQKFG
jgi:protein-disulfide isomerase